MRRANDTMPEKSPRERGSALLVTLMVMVGLSLLGLGFVAISETESAIAVNERNAVQVQAVAEAGTRAVVEWFQDPTFMQANNLMPPNNAAHANIKQTRKSGTYVGKYKAGVSEKLCDLPFGPGPNDRFYGTEIDPDIIINKTTEPAESVDGFTGENHLDAFNRKLFGPPGVRNAEVTDIRIFAPPIDGAGLVDDGTGKKWWVGGTRYGVATIQVTAQKFHPSDTNKTNPLATRVVRTIVGPFPLPIPGGPIQTASTQGINFGGSSDVYWGLELSAGPITDTKNPSCLPWANPYERSHIERGYADNVWPIDASSDFDEANYLGELLNKTFMDPWFGTRAFTTNVTANPGYEAWHNEVLTQNNDPRQRFGAFANQDADLYPTKKMVRFPDIRYTFWKRITKNGSGTKGLYYFAYDPATQKFKRNGTGTAQPAAYWVNTLDGARLSPGIYFFDTVDGSNPQRPDGTTDTTKLTPEISWTSADYGAQFKMVGFIYLNSVNFETMGAGNKAVLSDYNMPGEPFRDIGHPVVDPVTRKFMVDPTTGAFIFRGQSDGVHSKDDLNGNGRLDIVTEQRTFTRNDSDSPSGATNTVTEYVPKYWDGHLANPQCTVPPVNYNGSNAPATACSEPHEPYVNFLYPDEVWPGNPSGSLDVSVRWEAGLGSQRQKSPNVACSPTMVDGSGNPTWDQCTSNSYDDLGARKQLKAILDGIFYNEGSYDPAGNAEYFGALLYKGAVSGTGNPRIYFNESLVKGRWAPPGMPRVFIYSFESDDMPD